MMNAKITTKELIKVANDRVAKGLRIVGDVKEIDKETIEYINYMYKVVYEKKHYSSKDPYLTTVWNKEEVIKFVEFIDNEFLPKYSK